MNTKEFIALAVNKHGKKYGYEKTVFTKRSDKLIITCPIHGDFEQIAGNHLYGKGCNKCAIDATKLSLEDCKARAIEVHKGKYNYDHIDNCASTNKIELTCMDHEEPIKFTVTVASHLKGTGCRICTLKGMRHTLDNFLDKAERIHGKNRYDYSRAVYTGNTNKVIVGCDRHPKKYWFKVSPDKHTHKSKPTGCTLCTASTGEKIVGNYLIENDIEFIKEYVIKHNGSIYKFDFYIPSLNLIIEVHGGFHYRDLYITKDGALEKVQENDKIKEKWCMDNKIKLLSINNNENKLTKDEFDKLFKTYLKENISTPT